MKWHAEVDEEGNSNNCFDPITPFIMVCAEQQSTNHANPSLRSGAGVKGQANVRLTLRAEKFKIYRFIWSKSMSRKQFIESQGGTCKNWNWSWSFVNYKEKVVIFGAWDIYTEGTISLIFSEDWAISNRGRKNNGFPEAKEYIKLVEKENYILKIFTMIYSDKLRDEKGIGPAQIAKIVPELIEKKLIKIGKNWYATDNIPNIQLPEKEIEVQKFKEGISRKVLVNTYERNSTARIVCINNYGLNCSVCGFNFYSSYGEIGFGMIHIHHLIPMSKIKEEYILDPIKDLRPVCPNCHAVIHRVEPPLTIEEVKKLIEEKIT